MQWAVYDFIVWTTSTHILLPLLTALIPAPLLATQRCYFTPSCGCMCCKAPLLAFPILSATHRLTLPSQLLWGSDLPKKAFLFIFQSIKTELPF